MTTHNEVELDMIREKIAVVDFGVVDFARLMGNIFNDLRFEGKRQMDSRGVPNVHLTLDDGKRTRTIIAESSGAYEAHDIPPGDYKLSVDATTLPANYILPKDSFRVRISPVSTTVLDIPARALRSISGRVFLKVLADQTAPPPDPGKLKIGGVPAAGIRSQRGGQAGGRTGQAAGQASHISQQGPGAQNGSTDYNLVPMAGIQLSAGYGVVTSDENGNFLLRDLPAGELTITVVPVKTLPPDMKVPSGVVRMPADPIQVQGATIVISNQDLVPYLTGKTAAEVRDAALAPPVKVSAPPAPAPVAPAKAEAPAPIVSAKAEAPAPAVPVKTEAPAKSDSAAQPVSAKDHDNAASNSSATDSEKTTAPTFTAPALIRRAQPTGAGQAGTPAMQSIDSNGNTVAVAPGPPGSYEQQVLMQHSVAMIACLLGHHCKGVKHDTPGSSVPPDNAPR
jgi:hypothetical protein